jgi:hypothetical protein
MATLYQVKETGPSLFVSPAHEELVALFASQSKILVQAFLVCSLGETAANVGSDRKRRNAPGW